MPPKDTKRRLLTTPSSRSVALRSASCFSSPTYRGDLNHSTVAELQEGFRILTQGQKTNMITKKELITLLNNASLHAGEEELNEMLNVIRQDDHVDGLQFSDFVLLLTKTVDEAMMEEMRTAFLTLDKNNSGTITRKQFTELFVSMGEHCGGEELEELISLAEPSEDSDVIDYNMFITQLCIRVNTM